MRGLVKMLTCAALSIALVAEPALANYAAAQAYLARRDYVSAANGFFQAYAYPKGAGMKEKAEWGLAQSLYRLGLYYSASKYYSVIVRRGPNRNPFFSQALDELGKINSAMNLGQSHVVQLFRTKINPASVPSAARGFYFYYQGIEAFNKGRMQQAAGFFARVPSNSDYYVKAQFHLGVVANMSGSHSKAINYFETVRNGSRRADNGEWLREQANLNIARVHYEVKNFSRAMAYYAQIPRESDNWLQALFEASWAFFMMQKHNNVLGTIHTLHSPFFENRFFPESYVLQAITFLRLCRYKQVRNSLTSFKSRYQPTYNELVKMLGRHEKNPVGFFKLVYDYRSGQLRDYRKSWAILDSLSRTDVYKEAGNTIRFSDSELARLQRVGGRWQSSGLLNELRTFLKNKKSIAVKDAGNRLYDNAVNSFKYLKELSDQTRLINVEMVLGRIDALRAKLNVGTADKKANFIGGLQPLRVGQDYEYWPFEGEYWEDELGGYVYNIGSECKAGK